MDPFTHYYISVGSNIETAYLNVSAAIDLLDGVLSDAVRSSIYSTPSVSLGDTSTYCNAVVAGYSSLSPEELTTVMKGIESEFGRESDKSRGVSLDLDVVVADAKVLRTRDFSRQYFRIGYQEIMGLYSTPSGAH